MYHKRSPDSCSMDHPELLANLPDLRASAIPPMPDNENVEKKPLVTLNDLPPRTDAKGGSDTILRRDPPLPIPPPGFIVTPEDKKQQSGH